MTEKYKVKEVNGNYWCVIKSDDGSSVAGMSDHEAALDLCRAMNHGNTLRQLDEIGGKSFDDATIRHANAEVAKQESPKRGREFI